MTLCCVNIEFETSINKYLYESKIPLKMLGQSSMDTDSQLSQVLCPIFQPGLITY